MTRRPSIVLAALAAASLSGCTTFTDNGVAARVGDHELTEDQLAALLRERALADPTSGDSERISAVEPVTVINNFVLHEMLNNELAAGGVEVTELDADLTIDALATATNEVITTWQASVPIRPTDDQIAAWYEAGPEQANLVCSAHILVDTEARANEVFARLETGEPFGDVAASVSIDTGSAANGGALPCADVQTFSTQYIPEYTAAALGAAIDVPVGPIESQFGFHVIRLRPLADLGADELDGLLAQPSVRFGFTSRAADVYVNPRYGTFDPVAGVVPLG